MQEGQKGIEVHQAHFPGRVPIDAYGAERFRFADMAHNGALMCVPSGIYGWDIENVSQFSKKAFEKVFEESAEIEVLLVGTGDDLVPLNEKLREQFRKNGISADSMATGPAVRTYNVLISEGRAVAAAFLAVK